MSVDEDQLKRDEEREYWHRMEQQEAMQLHYLMESSQRQRTLKLQVSVAVVLASFIGVASIAYSLIDRQDRGAFDASGLISEMFKAKESVRAPDFEQAKSELLASFKDAVTKSDDRYFSGSGNAILSEEIAQLRTRLELIEKSISVNPERALSIPLLRRDQDELSRKVEEYRLSAKADSDRLWGQQNTILQFLGGLLLAAATGAITIIYRSVKQTSQT